MADRKNPKVEKRPDWDEYFLDIVRLVSRRSTCLRRRVGAVIVKEKRILTTGYNGAPADLPHCADMGCLRQKKKIPSGERHELCRGVHAEMNAFIQAARFGVDIAGATLYSTDQPCILCAKLLINAGIKKVVSVSPYPDKEARKLLRQAKIKVEYGGGKDNPDRRKKK